MVPCAYEFRSRSAADLPLVLNCLKQPHIAQWWGDPDEQFALICEDLDHPAMDQFIVTTNDRPFAYLQCFDPNASPNNAGFYKARLVGTPDGSALLMVRSA